MAEIVAEHKRELAQAEEAGRARGEEQARLWA
jgi:hypothetical protein